MPGVPARRQTLRLHRRRAPPLRLEICVRAAWAERPDDLGAAAESRPCGRRHQRHSLVAHGGINHAPAQMFLHTGFRRGARPHFRPWGTYGLGSENADLPAYVVLVSGTAGGAGTSMWSSGFLPSVHQGVQFRSQGDAVLYLSNPAGHSPESRRRVLDAVGALNRTQLADVRDSEIATRISQYEMAYRMQTSVPELMDLAGESAETLELYGAKPGKASFANNCLLARRLIERGVRVVELYDSDWDHHANLAVSLPRKCKDIDQPAAALLA